MKEGELPVRNTAIECLAAVAQHHGISVAVERLLHEHALEAGETPTAKLLTVARAVGLKARTVQFSWDELVSCQGVFPLLVRRADGSTLIVVGIRNEGAFVVDPLAPNPAPTMVPADLFRNTWQGETILLKREYALDDTEQPFGLRWFIPEILKHKAHFRDIALAALALHFIALATPIFFQLIIDRVLVHQSYSTLYVLAGGMVVLLVFEAVLGFLRQDLLLGATNKIDMRLARRTFSHLLALPIDYFESASAGVIVRHMQQAEKIRQFLTGRLFLTVLDASALVVFVPLLFLYSAKLALVVLVFTALIAATVFALIGPFRSRLQALYAAEGERQAMLVETIHGMRTVKSLAMEPLQRKQWDRRAASAVNMHFNVGRISITAQALTGLLEKLMLVSVIVLGAQDVFDLHMTVGALIAFQMISGRVAGPLVQIVSLVHEYQETAISVRMLAEIMNRPTEGRGAGGGLRPAFSGRIEFDSVGFRYPGITTPALDNISLRLPAGMVLGLVGRSGSGKSTFTRLVQGLYPVQQGVIRFDGVDVRELDLIHLRKSIGVVLQDNFMFRGSVRDNIGATKPDALFEEIVAAAQAAGADEFIERLPKGYDTLLEENAANLSGGQRQRLAIARALLPQPRILILDEAASALDPESEAIFIRNLAKIAVGKTVIIVSHRLSTLVNAHAIVVLERGRIVGAGRHQELLGRCEEYTRLWNQQSSHL
ncbi:MAG: peptidase domain-containing ABC transporter [Rhodocyclaceae bacterium]|nr:peptidase domain-containing ABC transporter [Rhodocyclaceae bacterium]